MSGKLCDGAVISQSVGLSKNGQWPFYTALYGYRGVILGWIQFTNAPATSLDGNVYWSKTAFASTFYPDGFDLATSVVGSTYVAPGSGQRVVAVTNALLMLDGGELVEPLTIGGVLATNNTASFTNGASLRLVAPSTGVVDGLFRHPALLMNKKFYGVALQQQNELRGYFPGSTEAGSFRVVNY